MATRIKGAFVLSSTQTFLDGLPCRARSVPRVGQVWSWQGDAIRLDGPNDKLLLSDPIDHNDLRESAARAVAKSLDFLPHVDQPLRYAEDAQTGFVVSDGAREFALVPVMARNGGELLYWCRDGLPKARKVYTVVRASGEADFFRQDNDFGGDVICFTTGTQILTPDGGRPVEHLGLGDLVQTRDNGAQQILWIGHRKMTGARLYAMPELRPIRIRARALGQDMPDTDLVVSPHHRILYDGPAAQALFNQSEVLITARDLIDDHRIQTDFTLREVTYVHLLLAEHQIVWANGVPTESYHPANTTLQTIEQTQRAGLLNLFPQIADDPYTYGGFARRNLDRSEAAILRYDFH
ncbi:MAG: Hint domain-containing protein [Pseudomonadota bacterium]